MKQPARFIVEDIGSSRECLADGLTVTEGGWLKLYLRGKLVGVIRSGSWTRVYLTALSSEVTQ